MRWTDRAVRAALGLGGPASDAVYSGISTDTRAITPGSLFVALKGERFDAHDFLPSAREAGATGAVVRRGTAAVPGLTLYQVEETGFALGELAHALGEDGVRVLNDAVVREAQLDGDDMDTVERKERIELRRRAERFRSIEHLQEKRDHGDRRRPERPLPASDRR